MRLVDCQHIDIDKTSQEAKQMNLLIREVHLHKSLEHDACVKCKSPNISHGIRFRQNLYLRTCSMTAACRSDFTSSWRDIIAPRALGILGNILILHCWSRVLWLRSTKKTCN